MPSWIRHWNSVSISLILPMSMAGSWERASQMHIIGPRTVEQLTGFLRALKIKLNKEAIRNWMRPGTVPVGKRLRRTRGKLRIW